MKFTLFHILKRIFRKATPHTSIAKKASLLTRLKEDQLATIRNGGTPSMGRDYTKTPTSAQQEDLNRILNLQLNVLNKRGLLSPQTNVYIKDKIAQNSYYSPFLMLDDIIYKETNIEWLNPTDVLTYFEGLKSNGIVSEASHQRLASDIKDYKISSSIELVEYYEKAVLIDLKQYPANPDRYLEDIHRKVASILPELAFTDFSFTEELDTKNDTDFITFYNFIVSLRCNGKLYKQKSLSRIVNHTQEKKMRTCDIETQVFYQLFNKILAENQSAYRLHVLWSNDEMKSYSNPFGLIALTKEQAEFLKPSYRDKIPAIRPYISITTENYKNNITNNNIEKVIEEWENLGLFKHLTDQELLQAKENAKSTWADNYNHLLIQFPKVIHEYDAEFDDIEDPYRSMLLKLAEISHNEFNPTDIVDGYANPDEEDMFTLSFNWNGKQHIIEFLIDGDWLDEEFFDNINNILEENNSTGRFYALQNNGQIGSVIYLTAETQQYLKSNNLLVF